MKKIKINIITDKILRAKLVKTEFKYKIFKSILQNNNIIYVKKYYIQNIFNRLFSGKKKISRTVNTCLMTGSRHSITQRTNFSRQQNKRFFFNNQYNNFKGLS